MKLIYIKSTMEPKNYAALRSLLKQEQGEKIAPYVFKVENIQLLQDYLKQERITYETYKLLSSNTKKNETPESEAEFAHEDKELEKAYRAVSQDKERAKLTKSAQKAALRDLQKRL